MKEENRLVHPYIPNSVPRTRSEMLADAGVRDVEELYESIPQELRLERPLDLPKAIRSELALKRHVRGLLAKNRHCEDYVSFLGGGCWQHYVPAVCDEIISRGEFLTAYGGGRYADLGKFQAFFEFQSLVGELVGMEVVSSSTYDWAAAATTSVLMASRITERPEVLVARTISPERLAYMRNFCQPVAEVRLLKSSPSTGLIDLDDLSAHMSPRVAAVYFENPSYLGFIESQGEEISSIAHAHGALTVVGVDPTSLGILAAPPEYGADIVCGDAQPLGNHMNYGGGLCGFVATRDELPFVVENPLSLVSAAPGQREGEFGFGTCMDSRTAYKKRERSADLLGTTQNLLSISAAVYLALMGPQGMHELGEAVMQKSHYAANLLSGIDGIKAPLFSSVHFKEFVVNFDETGRTVRSINKALLDRRIFGGKDISAEFPELGNSALYCVTEIHTKEQIQGLSNALEEVLRS